MTHSEDWRLLLQRLHATFVAPTADDTAAFVTHVLSTADADIDLRPNGVVHISIDAKDTDAAGAISAHAATAGLASQPLTASRSEVAIDAMDIAAIKPFWKAVLGYEDASPVTIGDPHRIGPDFWFQQMDEPRPERSTFHIDVTVPHDVAEGRVAAALAAGGTLLTDRYARAFWVLADAEGNEVCICTWQDRG